MPSINKCIVLLTLALSAVAANHGQHLSRNTHHDLAARAPVAAPVDALAAPVQKRASNSKRCKARPTSSSSSSTHSSTHSSSTKASSTKTSETHKASSSSKKAANADAAPTSTSSSSKYTPPPATTPKYTPTTSSKAATSTSGMTTGGVGTYYTQNGVAGACGTVHPDSAIICALQTTLYANGAKCGKTVAVTNLKNGKTVNVLVADECPSCNNQQSIDFSEGAFKALGGTVEEGEFPIGFLIL